MDLEFLISLEAQDRLVERWRLAPVSGSINNLYPHRQSMYKWAGGLALYQLSGSIFQKMH